ncbi:MAG: hypothetical protein KC547_06930, partial [Anaerolineae bacterium]|nr:hypothetical protein [Anaerolineae bacterium]
MTAVSASAALLFGGTFCALGNEDSTRNLSTIYISGELMIRLTVMYNLPPGSDEEAFLNWRLGEHQAS